jgi:hypothetical protein
MTPDPKALLTKEQAKARLGLANDSALRRLIQRGKLRVVKYSKTAPLRFRQMDIDACIESCAVTGDQENAERGTRNAEQTAPQPPAPGKAGKDGAR